MGEKSKAKYSLRKQMRKLAEVRGSGTELISVYIPPKYPIAEVSNKLKNEYGQAANIKSKGTRTNVLSALEKIMHYLKMFREPPENGIAIFCGNISSEPGKPDVELFSVVPHEPVNVQTYRCDSVFFLEPLEYMLEAKDSYGLVVMDGRDATVALLKGKVTKIIKRIHSLAHGKHHKGGQCLAAGTLLTKKDGASLPAHKVKKGDAVVCFDFASNKLTVETCAAVFKRRAKKAYRLNTTQMKHEIIATPEHVFFVLNANKRITEKYVDELQVGDMLLSADGAGEYAPIELCKKEEVKPDGFFYDLTIPNNENFVANGLIVHNSANRFQRLIEEETEKYYKRVGEGVDEAFMNVQGLKGVIVGGPGPAKEDFLKMKPFNYMIKVLGTVDTGYTDEYGVRELQKNAGEIISEQEAMKEKAVVEAFIKDVVKGGLATYGVKEVEEALQLGKASKLLVSEGLVLKKVSLECSKCGAKEEKVMREAEETECACGGRKRVVQQKDAVDELLELAEKANVEVEVISTDTNEGAQFFKGFYGIGALLRYR
ncbi:hypothetical protein HY992_01260 [Candidatus Micrarchaeota archaeon]|nr:hypothetical protein [Candidatus Micrarchaeota archaeon]